MLIKCSDNLFVSEIFVIFVYQNITDMYNFKFSQNEADAFGRFETNVRADEKHKVLPMQKVSKLI